MTAAKPLLEVEGLSHSFPLGRSRLFRQQRLQAVHEVSFTLAAGKTLGLVGESGSGKSTLARCVTFLHAPERGTVRFRDVELGSLGPGELRAIRRDLAMVFQNPYTSLDPTWTVEKIVGEPLQVQGLIPDPVERRDHIIESLERTGLDPAALGRHPSQFSGGQRQRIAIARALITDPALVVCDEAVSALDVSTRAQVLRLLRDLQRDLGLGYLFISHDLTVARAVSDEIAVMYRGSIVEQGPAEHVLSEPKHPYTQKLLAAAPTIMTHRRRAPDSAPVIEDETTTDQPVRGCSYAPSCPLVMDVCRELEPPLQRHAGQWQVACHAVNGVLEPAVAPSQGKEPV